MTTQTIVLEHMTSPEVADALARGFTNVLVACGAVEQHGPHLPLFVDAEHGTRLVEEVARRLGNTLVAPTIRIGCSEHHMSFAGTLSLERATFEAVCIDYCESLARHGFRRILFVPSHGGNFEPLAEMLPRLRAKVGARAEVHAFLDLLAVIECWRSVAEEEAGLGEHVGGHADIAEGSIMLHLHPELVHVDLAEPGFLPELDADVFDRIIRDGFDSVTPNGILGDARGLDAGVGERCIAELADRIAAHFRQGGAW